MNNILDLKDLNEEFQKFKRDIINEYHVNNCYYGVLNV